MTLSQTVNLIVEQQKVEVHIAAHLVNEVVTTDSQAIAVATHLPHCHIRVGNLETSGHCTATTVNGVEAVGVHVVRQTT